jgi:hypothetical protein
LGGVGLAGQFHAELIADPAVRPVGTHEIAGRLGRSGRPCSDSARGVPQPVPQ